MNMSVIWNFISYLGLVDRAKSPSNRDIINTNRLNFILIILLILLNIITAIIREINHGEYTIHTKKLLILLIICFLNIAFSYFRKHNLSKLSLIFIPSIIGVFLPIFLGYVQDIDYVYDPLIILGLSIVPQLILKPEFSNKLYSISLFYFFIQALFFDDILIYFSENRHSFLQTIGEYRVYYKLVLIAILLFIHTTLYYLRNLNYKNEIELQQNNEELKTKIEELNVAQQQLIQAEKMASLGILTAGVAHEINNPLNFIKGGIIGIEKYFKKNLDEHSIKVAPLINAINVGVKRASDIVSRLSLYSRRDDLPPRNCDMHTIIENCLLMIHNQIKDKTEIQKHFTNLPYKLIGNEGKLHQAIFNLIINACQSIEKNGIISITTNIIDNYFIISIVDNGCGIEKENLGRIFDPFYTTKDPGKGTGLGLSIVYYIIHEHNGFLKIESEIDKGTKAIIKLPIHK
jgi:signal transduction histidine kinase